MKNITQYFQAPSRFHIAFISLFILYLAIAYTAYSLWKNSQQLSNQKIIKPIITMLEIDNVEAAGYIYDALNINHIHIMDLDGQTILGNVSTSPIENVIHLKNYSANVHRVRESPILLYSLFTALALFLSTTSLALAYGRSSLIKFIRLTFCRHLNEEQLEHSSSSKEFIENLNASIVEDEKQREIIEKALILEKDKTILNNRLIEHFQQETMNKKHFIAAMSHEIRTPLNGMLGMVDMLSDTGLNESQKRYVDIFKRSGDSLLDIVNNILDYSKIDSGKLEPESIAFNICDTLNDCLSMFAVTAEKRKLELYAYLEEDAPNEMTGDPSLIRQILVNLIGNAIKFTKQGGVRIDVTHNASVFKFSVTDTGMGIPREHQPRIFEAFKQADASVTRNYGGTGLGLTICRQLVELMHGKIGFISSTEEGTCFWFELPSSQRPKLVETSTKQEKFNKIISLSFSTQMQDTFDKLFNSRCNEILHLDEKTIDATQVSLAHTDLALINFDTKDSFRKKHSMVSQSNIRRVIFCKPGDKADVTSIIDDRDTLVTYPVLIYKLEELLTRLEKPKNTEHKPAVRPMAVNHLNVLVAEDNAVNKMVIEGILSKCNIEAQYVENGQQALNAYRKNKDINLIFMDCEMPIMDGFDATKNIRTCEKEEGRPHAQIVALTAHVGEAHQERVANSGMNHFLSKPITYEKVSEFIEQLTDKSGQEQGDFNRLPPNLNAI